MGMKFGPLILRRIVKVVATKCQILRLKCTKIDFGCSSAPDPTVGAYIFSVYCLCCEQRSAAGLRRCPFFCGQFLDFPSLWLPYFGVLYADQIS